MLARPAVFKSGGLPRANLLPRSEVQRREVRRLARSWVGIGIGALVLTVVLIGAAFAYNMQAALRLTAANAQTQQVIAGIAELAPVSKAVADRTEISSLIEQSMGGDIEWRTAVMTVASALPAGVEVTDYSLAAGTLPTGDDPTTAVGAAGTFTVISSEPLSLVDSTRALRAVDAVTAVSVQSLAEADGVFTYTIEVELDQSIYSGDYAPEPAAEETD